MLGLFSKLVFLGSRQKQILCRGIPVFTWHKVGPVPPNSRDLYLYVSSEEFDRQLAELKAAGYSSSFPESIWSPKADEKPVVLAFDDAFANVLEHGLPVLARHSFRAIQFAVAGSLGLRNDWDIAKGDVGEPLMDEQQLREWLAAGHGLGSHSLPHKNLRHGTEPELRAEVFDSKKKLEDTFGIAVEHFCYPYGSYNPAVRDMEAEAGYRTACTVEFGVNDQATPRHEIKRIIPLSSWALAGKALHRLRRKVTRR